MLTLIILMFLSLVISTALFSIMLILGKKSEKELEKMTMFECGFEPLSTGRAPISLKFFLLTVIFLIFDIEIALLLPLAYLTLLPSTKASTISALLIMLILIIGLFHEWNQGMLEWIY